MTDREKYIGDGVTVRASDWGDLVLSADRDNGRHLIFLGRSEFAKLIRFGVAQGFEIPEDVR